MRSGSFKTRLLVAGSVLVVLILILVFFAQGIINESTDKSVKNLVSIGVLNSHLGKIKNNLQDTERLIYQQAINPDLGELDSFQKKIDDITSSEVAVIKYINKLIDGNKSHSSPDDNTEHMLVLSNKITETTNKLRVSGNSFFKNSVDPQSRIPGMRFFVNDLLPNNNRFIEATDLAIAESYQNTNLPRQTDVRDAFQNLRYMWSQQISWVRLFIANRSGVFANSNRSMKISLDNRVLYFNQVKDYINKLSSYEEKGLLDLQQSLSLDEVREIIIVYEKDFAKAKDMYLAKNWRVDVELLESEIILQFDEIWSNIRELDAALANFAKSSVNLSQSAANQSAGFVWGVGAIAFAMILLTYVLFDNILRRPIIQVARALDAEAAGKDAELNLKNSVEETELLIKAFRNMQDQVHQRQTRLESILDNAAEGIITIDESGIVETFNSAAQTLFGYTSDEVIGNNIKILVPETHRSHHDEYLAKYATEGTQNIVGITREVTAQRKNGSTFAMSLKVSEMFLDHKRHYTAVIEDISDRKALIQNLRNLAEHDSLTGLYNRLYFSEELEKVVVKKLRGDQNTIALLYIDLDNFKYVNDTMGHLAGDQLLVEVGSILKTNTRDADLLARLGGDEFAVILFRPDDSHIVDAAERFRASIEEYLFMCSGKSVNIGCSIGVAVLDSSIEDKDQILSRADIACAEAKKRGRNVVHIFTEEDEHKISTMSSDIGWVSKIKQSINNDRFVLAGQPIVSTASGETDFLEVLIRLYGDDGELIMPAGFMPSAERFALMADIDRWVIQHAFALLEQISVNDSDVRFSINLSANSLDDKNIIHFIEQQIGRYSINPATLLFEVTESIAIANLQSASVALNKLREFGCLTALDDFGVGYSSFTYLKELPVDYVKIDGSFVRDIDSNNLNLTFVKSMNDIAHAMGKKTIAEFVETQSCLEKLTDIGVDYAQGYFLGKPELFEEDMHQEALRIKHSA